MIDLVQTPKYSICRDVGEIARSSVGVVGGVKLLNGVFEKKLDDVRRQSFLFLTRCFPILSRRMDE